MDITKIVSIALCSLVLIILLRRLNNDYAFIISCFISILITIFSLAILFPVFDYIENFSQNSTYKTVYSILFKSAGICLLCSFASEICRDAGESALSSRVEFAGKCTLLSMSLPLIKKVFEYATTFID